MEGCPLAHHKTQGKCVNCPQVTDCVFLRMMKSMADIRSQLRDINRQLSTLKSA